MIDNLMSLLILSIMHSENMIQCKHIPSSLIHKHQWAITPVTTNLPEYFIQLHIQNDIQIPPSHIPSQIQKLFYNHLLSLLSLTHQILLALPLHNHGIHVHQIRSPRRKQGKRKRIKKHKHSKKNKPFHPTPTEYQIPETMPWTPQ